MLDNAWALRDGLEDLGFAVVRPQRLTSPTAQLDAPGVRDGAIVTPIVPILVGDDWKAVLLWRALYDAGVFVNTALHPAVPPGGALLRTSVMATHDRATIDRALEALRRRSSARSRPSTARFPGPATCTDPGPSRRPKGPSGEPSRPAGHHETHALSGDSVDDPLTFRSPRFVGCRLRR